MAVSREHHTSPGNNCNRTGLHLQWQVHHSQCCLFVVEFAKDVQLLNCSQWRVKLTESVKKIRLTFDMLSSI